MALRVDEDGLLVFAAANDQVAGEVEAGCQPDPELIAQMVTGYGPVGAEFTAAVADFQAAFHQSGTALARRFSAHAEDIRAAHGRYVDADQSGADRVAGSSSV
ncbi:type VII secretion target [Candidatus Mycobacterium methanotrophicum]|uniref:ESX-1 secretion-associated protein n=1 Tax=Candidatus Mycobacterium methanotrophicum TaxID=2943498 RepID=A0ABY4QTV2_9MYCO|nr:type VII secretion target [Candidatus Mycobacterium methanotrophicum]UQX13545.1 ESX-1 secretion-associated protein [Candidatus Mycobacterium methanotrophicum]